MPCERDLASFISAHHLLLYPHTPIEVRLEMGKLAIWVEGEWYHDCEDVSTVKPIVQNAIKLYIDDWQYVSTRINPRWEGWKHVSTVSMLDLSNDIQAKKRTPPFLAATPL